MTRLMNKLIPMLCVAAAACAALDHSALAQSSSNDDRFVLIRSDLSQLEVRKITIEHQQLHYGDARSGEWMTAPLDECIALLRVGARVSRPSGGSVRLADGQVLPGETLSNADPDLDAIVWNHAWLGRMEIPLDAVRSVSFTADTLPPPAGVGDVVLYTNGDRQSGLIVQFGDPIVLEIENPAGTSELSIPADRVAAVTLVSQPRPRTGTRIWFADGTIVDVKRLLVAADGYARIESVPAGNTQLQAQRLLRDVVAVFFRADALVPLASLDPVSIDGPSSRFAIPRPVTLDANAVADLSSLEFRGPLSVRYALPAKRCRFAATAELPTDARTWGDCELILECNGREVFRAHLSAANPTAAINVMLDGGEMTLRLLQAKHGSIQDRVVLHRAMFLQQ